MDNYDKRVDLTADKTNWINICTNIKLIINQSQNSAALLSGSQREFPIVTDPVEIAYDVIFNSIKKNKLAGIGIYHVETHQKTMLWMQKKKLEIYPNIYLGVILIYSII